MGSSQSKEQTPAPSIVPKGDYPCNREMDAYLACLKNHPKGLSGQVDECESIRVAYKVCMKSFNDTKNPSSNLTNSNKSTSAIEEKKP